MGQFHSRATTANDADRGPRDESPCAVHSTTRTLTSIGNVLPRRPTSSLLPGSRERAYERIRDSPEASPRPNPSRGQSERGCYVVKNDHAHWEPEPHAPRSHSPSRPRSGERSTQDTNGAVTSTATRPVHTKWCNLCAETKSLDEFPIGPPAETCTHIVKTCRACVHKWVRAQMKTKMWNELVCPTCPNLLKGRDLEESAPSDEYHRYVCCVSASPETFSSFPETLCIQYCWTFPSLTTPNQIHLPRRARTL